MALTIKIDLGRCTGCASCVMECPDVFDTDEVTGQSVALQPHPPEDRREDVALAVRSCPERAISFDED